MFVAAAPMGGPSCTGAVAGAALHAERAKVASSRPTNRRCPRRWTGLLSHRRASTPFGRVNWPPGCKATSSAEDNRPRHEYLVEAVRHRNSVRERLSTEQVFDLRRDLRIDVGQVWYAADACSQGPDMPLSGRPHTPICGCQDGHMVSPVQDLSVDTLDGPRWELALDLLQRGEASVNMRGLVLRNDPATAKASRRLHIEFECPFDPSQVGKSSHDRLESVASRDLEGARQTIETACAEDERFADLVAASGVVYEFVHRYGMGSLLVATASRAGDLSWR